MKWAGWVRERVKPRFARRLSLRTAMAARPAVYFWARTMGCPNPACRAEIPLVSSCWLANSTRRKAWVDGQRATR